MAEKKPWEDEKLEAFKMLCECYQKAFCKKHLYYYDGGKITSVGRQENPDADWKKGK